MSNEKIVIAEQFYIGYSNRDEQYYDYKLGEYVKIGTTKLGFATYYENNAACRKRQSTIDSWTCKANKDKSEIIDNKPHGGFKLSKKVTHGGGWNDLNVFWRIMDPRGFELEISSGNLAKLFQYCTIDHGNIQEECVWGWDKGNGSKVVLLPVNSEIYLESVKSTEVHNAKPLTVKDIQLGDEVELKSGVRGIYYGKPNGVYYSSQDDEASLTLNEVSQYVLLCENDHPHTAKERPLMKKIFLFATPNIIKRTAAEVLMTQNEAEKKLNEHLVDAYIETAGNSKLPLQQIVFFTYKNVKGYKGKIVYSELDISDFDKVMEQRQAKNPNESWLYRMGSRDLGALICTIDSGEKYMLTYGCKPGYQKIDLVNLEYSCNRVDKQNLDSLDFAKNPHFSAERKGYYGNYNDRTDYRHAASIFKSKRPNFKSLTAIRVEFEHDYGVVQHNLTNKQWYY